MSADTFSLSADRIRSRIKGIVQEHATEEAKQQTEGEKNWRQKNEVNNKRKTVKVRRKVKDQIPILSRLRTEGLEQLWDFVKDNHKQHCGLARIVSDLPDVITNGCLAFRDDQCLESDCIHTPPCIAAYRANPLRVKDKSTKATTGTADNSYSHKHKKQRVDTTESEESDKEEAEENEREIVDLIDG